MTRSGKSVLTYGVLAQVAHRPDVVVAGCDPTGVLLGPWRDHPHPEWRALTTANMAAHGDVIAALTGEMDRRISSLLDRRQDKLEVFTPGEPLLLVVLEEYPGALSAATADDQDQGRKPGERIAPRIKSGVRRLIQEGAKVGVRVFLLAQRMDAEIVGGTERSNLGNRFTLRVDNGDAVRMLHPSAEASWVEVVSQFAPGRGIVDRPGAPTTLFRADYISYAAYCDMVESGLELKG